MTSVVLTGTCQSTSTAIDAAQAHEVYIEEDATPFSCLQTMWYGNLHANTSLVVTEFDEDTKICKELHFTIPLPAAFDYCADCVKVMMSPVPCIGAV